MPDKQHEGRAKPRDKLAPSRSDDPDNAKVLQKRQLVARIAQRVGRGSSEVRAIVEATLAELGEAVSAGQTLALPPLGRARISRQKDDSGGEVIILRLRRRGSDVNPEADEND